jgi:diacylglycerol kinase family enzyme
MSATLANPTDVRSAYVILNGRSGATDKGPIAEQVAAHFAARAVRAEVVVATDDRELAAALERITPAGADLVVAGGGDGTIAGVASRLVDTGTLFGVLPLGTFNFFARRFGVPLDVAGALDVLARGEAQRVDIGEVNGRIFLNNASIGLYPTVLEKRETAYGRLGRSRALAYATVALALVRPPRLLNLEMHIDGERMARRTPLLFVGANAYQMENFAIPGRECVRLAHLAAYITRPLGAVALSKLALRAFFRGLHGAPELEVVCARELHVRLRRPRVRVALDGELVTLAGPLTFRMRTGALRVVTGGSPGGT